MQMSFLTAGQVVLEALGAIVTSDGAILGSSVVGLFGGVA
jgi:hypothetical protein